MSGHSNAPTTCAVPRWWLEEVELLLADCGEYRLRTEAQVALRAANNFPHLEGHNHLTLPPVDGCPACATSGRSPSSGDAS